MPFLSQETIEEVNISGHVVDNSRLNKIGKIRVSPLKSFAILLFAVAFVLPQAVSKISDLNLYLRNFSAEEEMAQAAEASNSDIEKENYSVEAEQKKIDELKKAEELKQKKLTLADIWPEDVDGKKSAPNIIPAAQQAVPLKVNAVQPQKQALVNIWPAEAEKGFLQPRRLVIPAIKVSVNIESLGIGQSGEMEAPKNYKEAGWFNLGPRLGEPGIAIIAGHLDSQYGAPGVFWHLSKLKAGDDIYITNESGKIIHFRVSGSKIYDANAPLGEFFSTSGSARLNLITCNGVWDKNVQNYTSRLVVSAELFAE